jgi:hypothetical protein
MPRWEFDHELNWTWWTFGLRYRSALYDGTEYLVGLGPLLLIWRKPFEVDE